MGAERAPNGRPKCISTSRRPLVGFSTATAPKRRGSRSPGICLKALCKSCFQKSRLPLGPCGYRLAKMTSHFNEVFQSR